MVNDEKLNRENRLCVVQVIATLGPVGTLVPWLNPTPKPAKGTGFFFDNAGFILTNAHVVKNSIAIQIRHPEIPNRIFPVELVGICPRADVAVLKLPPPQLSDYCRALEWEHLKFLTLGDSDKCFTRHQVWAIGYPLGTSDVKTTGGQVSGRQFMTDRPLLQTTAELNPGNSGGPMVDDDWRVMGINTAHIADAHAINFAIPITDVKAILEDIVSKKSSDHPTPLLHEHIDCGWQLQEGHKGDGALIVHVVDGGVAERAGIAVGDILKSVDSKTVDSMGMVKIDSCSEKMPGITACETPPTQLDRV